MKNRGPGLSIYRYKPGRYRVVIHWKGKRIDRIVAGTKAEAKAFEARLRVELDAEPSVETRVVPKLADFCLNHYRPHAELYLRISTWTNRKSHLVHLLAELGDLTLDEVTTERVEQYVRTRLADGLRPVSVNNELRSLRRVLNFAKRERRLPIPAPQFRQLSEPGRGKVVAWTEEEVGRLLQATAKFSPEVLPLVVFALNTGARKGEILAMKSENVDLDRRLLRIWSYDQDERDPSDTDNSWDSKNSKSREVPISDALLPWLTPKRLSGKWLFRICSRPRIFRHSRDRQGDPIMI